MTGINNMPSLSGDWRNPWNMSEGYYSQMGSTWVPLASVSFGAFVSISLLTNNSLSSK